MKTKILNTKNKLLELGYLDNEYLEKYLEILEANLETKKSRKSTQAHHAVPVNEYWVSNEPYKRTEALKLARVDKANFEVNLNYKDHLLAHAYLTLCTNLDKTQQKYEAQETLRKQNSTKAASCQKSQMKIRMPKHITEEKILLKLNKYDNAWADAKLTGDEKTEHHYRCLVAQWKSRYRQYMENPDKFTRKTSEIDIDACKKIEYHQNAQHKRELKSAIKQAHTNYTEQRCTYGLNSTQALQAKLAWKAAILAYDNFILKNNDE